MNQSSVMRQRMLSDEYSYVMMELRTALPSGYRGPSSYGRLKPFGEEEMDDPCLDAHWRRSSPRRWRHHYITHHETRGPSFDTKKDKNDINAGHVTPSRTRVTFICSSYTNDTNPSNVEKKLHNPTQQKEKKSAIQVPVDHHHHQEALVNSLWFSMTG